MAELAISAQEIANREHIAPTKTGDNIAAKKVAPYGFDPTTGQWTRQPVGAAGLITANYDSFSVTATSSTVNTYQFFSGGLSGTLVATLTITYTDSTQTVLQSVVKT